MMSARKQITKSAGPESGAILVLALLMMFIGSVLALSLLLVTENEMKTSGSFDDHQRALMAAEAGVQEVLWRLRMYDNASVDPMVGSRILSKGLSGNNAYIQPDRLGITPDLEDVGGDRKGKDLDGDTDSDSVTREVDELNHWKDWEVRLLYDYTYSDSDQTSCTHTPKHMQIDNDSKDKINAMGDKLIIPAVFSVDDLVPSATQMSGGKLFYTIDKAEFDRDQTPDKLAHESPDVLSVRFLQERDVTNNVDVDGDGDTTELVFYDSKYTKDKKNNDNSLAGRDTGTVDNESPFNLDFNGATDRASGFPVLLIRSTGRVQRGKSTVARRRVEAWVTYDSANYASSALCGIADLEIRGSVVYSSYDSKDVNCHSVVQNKNVVKHAFANESGCALDTVLQSDVSANGRLILNGNGVTYNGALKGFLGVDFLNGDMNGPYMQSGGNIVGCASPTECIPNDVDMEKPCIEVDVVAKVALYKTANQNATGIKPSPTTYWNQDLAAKSPSNPFDCSSGNTKTISVETRPNQTAGVWWFQGGGNYWFEDFLLSGDARVIASQTAPDANCVMADRVDPDNPVNIYVEKGLQVEATKDYKVFEYLRPYEYIIWHAGGGTFDLGPRLYTLSLYSPLSKVDFSGHADIQGFITTKASDSFLNGNATFYYDRNAADSFRVTGLPRILQWRELDD